MRTVVECDADEALARAMGILPREIEHFPGKGEVCKRLENVKDATGMMDEDPGVPAPSYFRVLAELSWIHGVRLLFDRERHNRVIVLSPRLEEWLVQSAKDSDFKMTDYGFNSDSGVRLHAEINQRLPNLERLVKALLSARNSRILHLQKLIRPA
jgi:hypothetical protein